MNGKFKIGMSMLYQFRVAVVEDIDPSGHVIALNLGKNQVLRMPDNQIGKQCWDAELVPLTLETVALAAQFSYIVDHLLNTGPVTNWVDIKRVVERLSIMWKAIETNRSKLKPHELRNEFDKVMDFVKQILAAIDQVEATIDKPIAGVKVFKV